MTLFMREKSAWRSRSEMRVRLAIGSDESQTGDLDLDLDRQAEVRLAKYMDRTHSSQSLPLLTHSI